MEYQVEPRYDVDIRFSEYLFEAVEVASLSFDCGIRLQLFGTISLRQSKSLHKLSIGRNVYICGGIVTSTIKPYELQRVHPSFLHIINRRKNGTGGGGSFAASQRQRWCLISRPNATKSVQQRPKSPAALPIHKFNLGEIVFQRVVLSKCWFQRIVYRQEWNVKSVRVSPDYLYCKT